MIMGEICVWDEMQRKQFISNCVGFFLLLWLNKIVRALYLSHMDRTCAIVRLLFDKNEHGISIYMNEYRVWIVWNSEPLYIQIKKRIIMNLKLWIDGVVFFLLYFVFPPFGCAFE